MADKDLESNLAALQRQVALLQDERDVIRNIDEYGKALDERRWDDWEKVFSEDAVTDYPWGHNESGVGMGRRGAEILKDFIVTEHLSGNIIIDLDGDHAKSRRNCWIISIKPDDRPGVYFTEGGVYNCEHVRTPDGWRISRVLLTIKWTVNGTPL